MTGKIYEAIPMIMAEVGAIAKTRKNMQGSGYMFRGIDDVYAALQPLLFKHRVFFVPEVLESVREERTSKAGGTLIYTVLKVKYKFFADDGSTFESVVTGEAMDSGDKSSNKAMSSALKYVLLQVFCIPTEEEKDTEYHSPEVESKNDSAKTSSVTPKPLTAAKPPTLVGKALCEICGTELTLTKNQNAYNCPNWKDKSQGNHSYVNVSEIAEFIESQQDIAL